MKRFKLLLCLVLILTTLMGCFSINPPYKEVEDEDTVLKSVCDEGYFDYAEIPEFDGASPYVVINNNIPFFDEADYVTRSYEEYGELDVHGRCTVVCANIGKDLMPTEERGSIGYIKPSGWQIQKYDFIDGMYLYNRCHLIGFQLTGENANVRNLITGTRYLNVQGMLPFENMVADYIKETDNHVLYRVTPIFLDGEAVARGVLMEGRSVEDDGEGICFNVFCYNNQPKIVINYETGESVYVGTEDAQTDSVSERYVLNTSSKRFHYPSCPSVKGIRDSNKKNYSGSREEIILEGYSPCGNCKP